MPPFSAITYIYALVDPNDGVIRYIGKADHPGQRLEQHLEPRALKSTSPANRWLKNLVERSLRPSLKLLDVVAVGIWQSAETWWIGNTPSVLNSYGFAGTGKPTSSDKAHHPGAIVFTCDECGARFSLAYYRASGVPRFCGQSCYHAMRLRLHLQSVKPYSLEKAFWSKVEKTSGCWNWIGPKKKGGYGTMCYQGKGRSAHCFSYELHVGPIPAGLDLDHLCRNRACVRPDHLEPVTKLENQRRGESMVAINRRKTHCMRGHEFSEANTRVGRDGDRLQRICRACQRSYSKAYKAQKRSESGLNTEHLAPPH